MTQQPDRSTRDPNWRSCHQFSSVDLPLARRSWLLDDGSLTARLVAQGGSTFRVLRLAQYWQVPLASEQSLLSVPERQLALIREVILELGSKPVVYARSVFPVDSISGALRHLRQLQNRSLGSILFKHPGMRRSPFELAQLPGNSAYLPTNLHQPKAIWARRSRFDINHKPLLVSEVFLPDFNPWSDKLPVHRSQRGRVSTAILKPKQ
ncbi:MAG: chorismate lyase [Halioglobus sp.]